MQAHPGVGWRSLANAPHGRTGYIGCSVETIERVESIPFSIPYAAALGTAIGTTNAAEHGLIRVTDSDGAVGSAEAIPRAAIHGETVGTVMAVYDEFEKKLAAFLGVNYLITVNSGSSANLVAFSTLTSPKLGDRAIRRGDEVIGVAAGFPTTVNPIIQFGAVPVFVDVELGTYNIDASRIEAAISPKTKAIMLAHTLGNPYNLEVISALCKKYNLWLIEDCCDALGATYNGQLVGTFGRQVRKPV